MPVAGFQLLDIFIGRTLLPRLIWEGKMVALSAQAAMTHVPSLRRLQMAQTANNEQFYSGFTEVGPQKTTL